MGRRREQAKGESGGDGCPTQVLITRNSLPVQAGLVVSLARPGGNATGASLMGGALGVKRVGLLRELVPDATAFAVLANPNNSNSRPDVSDVETAVRTAGLRPIILQASTAAELDAAFAKFLKERANALVVTADPFFTLHVAGRSLRALFQEFGESRVEFGGRAGLQNDRPQTGSANGRLNIAHVRP